VGGAGADRLVAVAGDTLDDVDMIGGDGADTFIMATEPSTGAPLFLEADLLDFEVGVDKIDVSDLRDAQGNTLDFADIQARLGLQEDGGVSIDLDGLTSADGSVIDGRIQIDNVLSVNDLSAADFIFTGGNDWVADVPQDVSIF